MCQILRHSKGLSGTVHIGSGNCYCHKTREHLLCASIGIAINAVIKVQLIVTSAWIFNT